MKFLVLAFMLSGISLRALAEEIKLDRFYSYEESVFGDHFLCEVNADTGELDFLSCKRLELLQNAVFPENKHVLTSLEPIVIRANTNDTRFFIGRIQSSSPGVEGSGIGCLMVHEMSSVDQVIEIGNKFSIVEMKPIIPLYHSDGIHIGSSIVMLKVLSSQDKKLFSVNCHVGSARPKGIKWLLEEMEKSQDRGDFPRRFTISH